MSRAKHTDLDELKTLSLDMAIVRGMNRNQRVEWAATPKNIAVFENRLDDAIRSIGIEIARLQAAIRGVLILLDERKDYLPSDYASLMTGSDEKDVVNELRKALLREHHQSIHPRTRTLALRTGVR